MSGTMSIGGVASGLKTDEIIAKVMEYARRPQTKLQNNMVLAQQQLQAWQAMNTRILALKIKCDSIANSAGFELKRATSSNMDIVVPIAGETAPVGTYYLKVNSRAQSHQVASETFNSVETDVGTGTVEFSFSQDATKDFSVTVDSANNTLAGLRDAINRAEKGIQAVIINSGSDTDPSYQLLVSADETGAASEFTVSTAGLAGGTQTPNVNQIVQQGDDAEIVFGEGAGAITVSKTANTITDLIPGVTLSIGNPDPEKTVKVSIARDTSSVKNAIEAFVQQYNDLSAAIESEFAYDSETGDSGMLLGSTQLQLVQASIGSVISQSVTGVSTSFSVLSSVGITLDTEGKLQIDDAILTEALDDNPTDVMKLFAAKLTSESTYVSYVSANSDTKASGAAGWTVDVTQAARRAQVTAAVPVSAPLDQNETLTINSKTISLTAGMSLTEVINKINEYSSETGVSALSTGAGGSGSGSYLTLRHIRHGSKQDFTAYSSLSNGSGNTSGLGHSVVSGADPDGETGTGVGWSGLDVEGTINGERATGNGQILKADPEDSDSDIKGLVLNVTTSSPLSTKAYYTKGIGVTLRDMIVNMTSSTGLVTSAQDSLTTEIDDLTDRVAEMEERYVAQEDRLWSQFNAMESQLSKLQQQGNYLTSQLAALNTSK